MTTLLPLGQTAYQAYATATGGRTHDGRDMPTWDEISDLTRGAWVAAAHAVVDEVEHRLKLVDGKGGG